MRNRDWRTTPTSGVPKTLVATHQIPSFDLSFLYLSLLSFSVLETHHLSSLSPSLPFKPWDGHPTPSPLLVIFLHPILSLPPQIRNLSTSFVWSLVDVIGALALAIAVKKRASWANDRDRRTMREREGEPSSEGEKRKRELKLEVEVRDGDWESKRVAAM